MASSIPTPFGGYEAPTTQRFVARVASIFCLVYFMAWIDKANIGFAKLQMLDDLNLSEVSFGLGASMFFLGYILIDVPVAFLLPRFKAPHLLSTMVLGFGVVTVLLGFTTSAETFYTLRFVLGLFEGGLSSAILFYVAGWTPYGDRARVAGLILGVALIANVIGAVLCGALLDLDGLLGLRGWQWLFIWTGLPSVVLGLLVLKLVPAGPHEAQFYTAAEKAELARTLKAERRAPDSASEETFAQVLLMPRVWLMMAILAVAGSGTYGLSYWLPTVIQQFGVSNTMNGVLSGVPWLLGIATMFWLPTYAERSGRSSAWILVVVLSGALAFALMALTASKAIHYVLICIGAIGLLGLQPLLLVMPSRFLHGRALAYCLPMTALATNLGAFFSQNAIAHVGAGYGPTAGLLYIAAVTIAYALLAAWFDTMTSARKSLAAQPA
jgi:sugar phosphate permease